MNSYTIYMHTSPNNKRYVGITSQAPNKRWQNGNGYERQTYFYNAILKYGWKGFKHQILHENLTEDEAKRLEKEYIKKFKTNNRTYGYNISEGGEGTTGYKHTEETKERLRKSRIGRNNGVCGANHPMHGLKGKSHPSWGKKLSDDAKQKISKANKGRKRTEEAVEHHRQVMTGRRHNKETKGKISRAQTGKTGLLNPMSKRVYQYSKNGELVRVWESTRRAEAEQGFDSSSISRCCNGKYKQFKGYIWRYEPLGKEETDA